MSKGTIRQRLIHVNINVKGAHSKQYGNIPAKTYKEFINKLFKY